MDEREILILVVSSSLVILLIGLALFSYAVIVAVELFGWAASAGFIGIALYILLWVVATPVMIVVCVGGAIVLAVLSLADKFSPNRKTKQPLKPGEPEYYDWANREGKWSE